MSSRTTSTSPTEQEQRRCHRRTTTRRVLWGHDTTPILERASATPCSPATSQGQRNGQHTVRNQIPRTASSSNRRCLADPSDDLPCAVLAAGLALGGSQNGSQFLVGSRYRSCPSGEVRDQFGGGVFHLSLCGGCVSFATPCGREGWGVKRKRGTTRPPSSIGTPRRRMRLFNPTGEDCRTGFRQKRLCS